MSPAYEYRHLSAEERAAVVRQRRERGYPLHAPPHPFRLAAYYFITAANYEHAAIMHSPERRTEFEGLLLTQLAEIGADVGGWAILPNHYHFVAGIDHLDHLSQALKHLHGVTARQWNLADGLTGKRQVWYKFRDRVIRNDSHYHRALNYIHYNPVKHGYVQSAYDWPWTSLENYLVANGRDWLRQCWRQYPPGDGGAEWCDIE